MQLKKNLIWISCAINSIIYIFSTGTQVITSDSVRTAFQGHKKKIKAFVAKKFRKKGKKPTSDYETTPNTQRMTIMTNSAVGEESVRLHSRPSSGRDFRWFFNLLLHFFVYINDRTVVSMISIHSVNCSSFITSGGANRIIWPWVGLARRPLSLSL